MRAIEWLMAKGDSESDRLGGQCQGSLHVPLLGRVEHQSPGTGYRLQPRKQSAHLDATLDYVSTLTRLFPDPRCFSNQ